MNRLLTLGVAATLLAAGTGDAVQPSSQRHDLSFVRVLVETADGTPVTGLAASDFEILSDGNTYSVQTVSDQNEPLTIVCLVDVSASMVAAVQRLGKPAQLADVGMRSLQAAMRALAPPHRFRIGSFSGRSIMSPAFSSDPRELVAAVGAAFDISEADRSGPSAIWDAVGGAIDLLSSEPAARAVVVITDGQATGNRLSLADVIRRAQMANVPVSVIGEGRVVTLPQDAETGVRVNPEVPMRQLTDETGGFYLADGPARTSATQYAQGIVLPAAPGALLSEIVTRLQRRHTLGFSLEDGPLRWRAIEVRVKRPSVKVRTPFFGLEWGRQ